jgi:hypothetical protein
MAISLLPDVMGSREKLQLALSGYRDDTGCIEIHRRSATIVGRAADQQKAPDRSGAFAGVHSRATPAAAPSA